MKVTTLLQKQQLVWDVCHDQDLKLDIIDNMLKYGGNFVCHLAHLMAVADNNNLRKVSATFINYLEEYHPDKWRDK